MKLEIPIIVGFDDMESLLDDLKKLQAYKCFEGAEEVLVDIEDVAKVLMDHVKAKEFDLNEKIDKAYDDGYETGYLQGKADYEPKTGKWIEVHGFCTPGGDPVWACSECGKGLHVYGVEHGSYGRDVSDGQWKACPNCGSMMLKEGEDNETD